MDFVQVSKNCSGEYRKRVQSVCVPKIAESGSVPEKGRIRASIEKLFRRVPGKDSISVCTEKMVEFGSVPEKGRIRASIEILLGRVPEKGPISVRTEKW